MAGCVPKEKAGELIELYGDMLEAGTPINELEYRRAVRDLEKENTANAVSALGKVRISRSFLPKLTR